MKIADKNALTTMKNIIIGYLDGHYDRNEAATKLYAEVNADVLQRSDSVFMVTDCFYTIAHLTEVGYETTDFEMTYFRDCLVGLRTYNLEEKNSLILEYYKSTSSSLNKQC